MAAAYVYSLDNTPETKFVFDNGNDVRWLKYLFRFKTQGLKSWNFICTTKAWPSLGMIPFVWSFMIRRRTKDYVKLNFLVSVASRQGLLFKPSQVMIDFEFAAKKAFDRL